MLLFLESGIVFSAPKDPAILIDDSTVLSQLPSMTLYELIGSGNAKQSTNLKEFYERDHAFRTLAGDIQGDLEESGRRDGRASVTLSTAHRLFDVRWLASSFANFELTAIVNRLDRFPFHRDRCGETRLVYRLRYSKMVNGEKVVSRLPMTINLVFWQDKAQSLADCRKVAERWNAFRNLSTQDLTKKVLANGSPLSSEFLNAANLKSLEVNLQAIRWPSTTKPDLGAHAEYFLRVFTRSGQRWESSFLENTPDLERLKKNPQLRKELLTWLREGSHAEDLAAGIGVIPDRFLTKKISSFSPRGLHRIANRPFSLVFQPSDFKDMEFAKLDKSGYVTSPEAYLRRLDDLSCAGCHQARTVAGFHLLGTDREDTSAVNFVNVTGSPHLLGDLKRREIFLKEVLDGKSAKLSRSFSERSDEEKGGYGAHCGLGVQGFDKWTCASGFSCQAVGVEAVNSKNAHLAAVGFCFTAKVDVGDPCEFGNVVTSDIPTKDRTTNVKDRNCVDGGVCYNNYGGFPDGMCGIDCSRTNPNSSCGAIAILKDFNGCLARGNVFTKCVRETTDPLGLRKCDDANPCRDDYLCVKSVKGEGACIPPYFLFQMRVDGHPRPF